MTAESFVGLKRI